MELNICPICGGLGSLEKFEKVIIDNNRITIPVKNVCNFCKGKKYLDWIECITGVEKWYISPEARDIDIFRSNKEFNIKKLNELNKSGSLWKKIQKKFLDFLHVLFAKVIISKKNTMIN